MVNDVELQNNISFLFWLAAPFPPFFKFTLNKLCFLGLWVLHLAITWGNTTKNTFRRPQKSKFMQNTKHRGMSHVKNKSSSTVCLKNVQTECTSWQVRASLSTLYQHLGFCKDRRCLSIVHLDCADDVLNAPVRLLGGPHLLATSRLNQYSWTYYKTWPELSTWPTLIHLNSVRLFIPSLEVYSHFKYAQFCFTTSFVSCHTLFFSASVLMFVLCMKNNRHALTYIAD